MGRRRLALLLTLFAVVAAGTAATSAFRDSASAIDAGARQGATSAYDRVVRRSDGGPVSALKDPKLSSQLVVLADAAARAQAAGSTLTPDTTDALPIELRGMIEARALRVSPAGTVQVFILVDDARGDQLEELKARGAQIERVAEDQDIVQAQVPPERLRSIAALDSVQNVRLPGYPELTAGAIQTEGDAIIQSDDARTTYGIDGSGVTIGVISDGVGGLAAAQLLGDLPAVDTTTCNVVPGDPELSGAEGTALLEVVHDVAPGATLMFGHFGFATALDFNAAVDCLAANADIVVDDVVWFGLGAYDGTSIVSANTAAALNGAGPIRGYYTSVGNQARRHYQGVYVDSGLDITMGPDTWDTHELNPTAGPKGTQHSGQVMAPADYNRFVLGPGGTVSIILTWDDAWGASGNDYDLFVGDTIDTYVCGADLQDGNDDPIEGCGLYNPNIAAAFVDIFIGNKNGAAAPADLEIFLLCSGCGTYVNGNVLDFNTIGSSVPNQADGGGSPASVISVGAVPQSSPSTIEPYSSRGLTEDGRLKPDLVAPDGTCITGSGGFAAGNPSCQVTGRQFFGTSAAAPHVAGVAALLLECDPTLGRVALMRRLLDHAVDLGGFGPDNVFGSGRVDALASADATGGCGAPVKLAYPGDTDGDGCADERENGLDETAGGLRNYANPYDFYDVYGPGQALPLDGQVDLANDILAVIQHYAPTGVAPYAIQFDRGPQTGANVWNMSAPDGVIDLANDILGVILQYLHNCG